MAVSVVSFVGTKAQPADAVTGWVSFTTLDTDTQLENTGCVGKKVSATTDRGYQLTSVTGAPYDFNNGSHVGHHIFGWLFATKGVDTQANGGFGLVAAADAATDAVGEWYVGPPAGYAGGWASFVVSPALDFDNLVAAGTPGWTVSGNPEQLDPVSGFGGRFKITSTISGNIRNAFIDAISVGLGYRVTNGDGASADATFSDFATFEATSTNRFGALSTKSGVLFPQCKLYIGFASGAGDTAFTHDGFTVIWENARVASDFYELAVQKGSGTTNVTLSNGSFSAVSPTEVYLNLKGGTAVSLTNVNADRARLVDLDGAVSWVGGSITNSGTIDLGGAPTFQDITVRSATDTIAMNVDAVSELANMSSVVFDGCGVGGSGSCAIRLNLGSGNHTLDLDGVTFQNRVASSHDILVPAGVGDVTINVVNGGSTPTVNNQGSGTITINNNVEVTLTGLVNPTEVRVYTRDGGGNNDVELAGGEDVTSGSFAFTAQAGLEVNIVIFSVGYLPADIYNFTVPNQAASLPVQQIFDRNYANP